MSRPPLRLTVALTHPIQTYSPWFRWITDHCPELDLAVVYAVEPTPEQQGTGFGRAFTWDVPLTAGHRCQVLRAGRPGDEIGTGSYLGLDVPELADAVLATRPEVALVPGWFSVTLTRVHAACHRAGIPVLYRGDSTLASGPRGLARIGWHLAWRTATRWRLGRYDGHLAVGQRAREYLLAHGVPGTGIFASPHALDAAALFQAAEAERPRRAEIRAAWGLPADAFVVLFAGKLTAIKRPFDLLDALARLSPRPWLLVAGSGPLEAECRARAERLGVPVAWAGFLNQTELARAHAAADCLVLPSASETWGFAAHEALAAGLPVLTSDTVGAAPDLGLTSFPQKVPATLDKVLEKVPADSGMTFPVGDVTALASALEHLRAGLTAGRHGAEACHRAAARLSFEAATTGLVAACERLARPPASRVMALCSGMVFAGGLERMTFHVLRTARKQGAAVHTLLNSWENQAMVPLAEAIGSSWSIARYLVALDRRTANPLRLAAMAWDLAGANLDLLRAARRFRPTVILAPEQMAVLRHAPALGWLRLRGTRVVLRLGTTVPRGSRFHTALWSRFLPRFVDQFVVISQFIRGRLEELGVPRAKLRVVPNAVAPRPTAAFRSPSELREWMEQCPTLLSVGQVSEFKGSHLFVEAVVALRGEGRDVQGLVVGRPPDWPPAAVAWYEALVQRAQGQPIRFVGEREDVPALMAAATVFAAPILGEEGFGNVVLEARQAGLPAVVFPNGGLPELVEPGVTGVLCPSSDLTALLAGLRTVLDDPDAKRRTAESARAHAADPRDPNHPERFAAAWWEVLR